MTILGIAYHYLLVTMSNNISMRITGNFEGFNSMENSLPGRPQLNSLYQFEKRDPFRIINFSSYFT